MVPELWSDKQTNKQTDTITEITTLYIYIDAKLSSRSLAAAVHLNFRAGSTFPVPVCTVSPGHWVTQTQFAHAGATKLTRSDFRMNSLLLKGRGCVQHWKTDQI